MAVYKRSYHRYAGELSPEWSRFLILYRYSKQKMFRSRLQTGFFVVCWFYPVICLLGIYLAHNLSFLQKYNIDTEDFIKIDNEFFFIFVSVQGVLAFILTVFTGPGLISPDLANGALPLYLCRPFSRAEYILGKMSALGLLLSQITWIPGLILFAVQASVAGRQWFFSNLWIAGSIVLSFWIWISILCLLSMAISAWVKWRIIAGAFLLGVFFLGAGFAQAINAIMRTQSGSLVDIGSLITAVWVNLFRLRGHVTTPVGEAWIALLSICGICLWLLMRKVRAYEVIN